MRSAPTRAACVSSAAYRAARAAASRVPPVHRDGRDVDGNAETRPESPNEFGVGGRLRPQLVVDVKHVEPQPPFRSQARQEVEQRHGIGAARDGD